MGIAQIIKLLSGVALFLYGMSLMGDGLKKASGNKLEPILFRLSGTVLKGVLLGTGVTAVIQSSSATSVMTVGFVNAGIMKLRQAIAVILGAILGTSITGWIICLSYIDGTEGLTSILSTSTLTGVAAVIGIIMKMFSKKQSSAYIGDILMGFAILMFGMSQMSGSVSNLGETEWFRETLISMSNPVVGILVGLLLTSVLQSASASVGILQALSMTGAVSLEVALPLLFGISIGGAVPVMLTALGASRNGKRAALVYLVSTIVGVMSCASIFYIADAIVGFEFMGMVVNPFSIAAVNTFFRLCMITILTPFIDVIEAIVMLIIPEKPAETEVSKGLDVRLEERFLEHPALAIEQCRRTMNSMATLAKRSMDSALGLLWEYSDTLFDQVTEMENEADQYEDILGTYLTKLTGKSLTIQQSREVSKYFHVLSDFERITDHARNVAELAKDRCEREVDFSEEADHELHLVTEAVTEVTRLTTEAFVGEELDVAREVEPLEQVVDEMCEALKLHHVERLQQGTCTVRQGFIFNDLLTNLERVSDHCSNVAVDMIELEAGNFDTHEYLDHLKERRSAEFDEDLERFRKQFAL